MATMIEDVIVALPRITINGIQTHFTQNFMLDHLNRRVSGRVVIEGLDPLYELLRSLRRGDVVDLQFKTYIAGVPDSERVEYEGKAEPIMVRIRPSRRELLTARVSFRLLD